MSDFTFLETPGMSISQLVMNSNNNFSTLLWMKDVVGAGKAPIKYYIDWEGLGTTFDPGTGPIRQIDAQIIQKDVGYDFINKSFSKLKEILDVDFLRVFNKEDSNISFHRLLPNDPALDGASGLASYTQDLVWKPEIKRWTATDFTNNIVFSYNEPRLGSNFWEHVIIHELGHALGLEHPFNDGDGDVYGDEKSTSSDQLAMAYGAPAKLGVYSDWFSPIEVEALVNIWGLGEWSGNVAFNLEKDGKISDIAKQWFGTNEHLLTQSQIIDYSNPQLINVKTRVWSKKVKINKVVQASSSGDIITAEAPQKFVPAIGSVLNGGKSGDILRGKIGWDIIDGGGDSDFIHGGQGRDVITGSGGRDELWGDFGLNTFKSEKDGSKDLVVIKSDHYVYNWLNDSYTNNPNGERTDFIEGLEMWDRIRVTGGYKQDLRFVDNVTHMGQTGIAIYLKDSLEALYTGNDLSLDQIKNMTSGDGSAAAIANTVHQYGLDWF